VLSDTGAARSRALTFILLTVALDAMGIGILVPVIPKLLQELTGQGLDQSAVIGGWLTAVFAGMQFLAAPLLGALSDRFGRRPVLLISLGAFSLSYVLMGIATTLSWLFVAQTLTGLFGATPSTAGAYIADVTEPSERTRYFGSMAAAFGSGLVIGPALGGIMVEHGTRVPFFAAALLSLFTVVYGFAVMPESLAVHGRRQFSWLRANPFGALRELRRNAGVPLLLGAALLQRISTGTLPAIWPYFTMQVYQWTPRTIGYSLGAYGLVTVGFQAGLIRYVDKWIGTRATAALGLAMLIVGYFGFAFGHSAWVVLPCIVLTAMGFMAGPALASLLSLAVPSNTQGSLQGMLASINGIAAVLTPLAMPPLFSAFSSGTLGIYFPGAPYVLGAALAAAGIVLVRGKAISGWARA
jgi:DHA1 family tetracycline resistance protein-like MFS transporter